MVTVVTSVVGQAQKTTLPCGTMEYLERMKRENPNLEELMRAYESRLAASDKGTEQVQALTTIVIPVVVHIVYNTNEQNVTDDRIYRQIATLNADFAGLNPNSMAAFSTSLKANTGIQFCLAQKSPNGTSTTGIVRRQTNVASFITDNSVKFDATGGSNAWDPNLYLNIWVCNLGNGGYGQFPGTGSLNTFGLVVNYNYFGVGDSQHWGKGNVGSHEVGHCFNLRHTWGDDGGACTGTDYCADTPNEANYGPRLTQGITTDIGLTVTDACATSSPGVMYMNFMDYANDYTYANFTSDQTTRMRANFASPSGALQLLASSTTCNVPSACEAPTELNVSVALRTSADITWAAMQNATSYNLRYRKVGTATWNTAIAASNMMQVNGLTRNTSYEFQVQTLNGATQSAFSYIMSFRTAQNDPPTALPPPTLVSPVPGGMTPAVDVTLSWNAVTGATGYEVQYSMNGDLTNAIQKITTSVSTSISNLMYNTAYYWRSRATVNNVTSNWSAVRSFTTPNGQLPPPIQTAPLNNATNVALPCTLLWDSVPNATGYLLQYSTNGDMTGALEITRPLGYTTRCLLAYNTQYFWRVKTTNGTQASAWSDIWTFTTTPDVLAAPVLTVPSNNAQNIAVAPTFNWQSVTNAEGYELQYASNSAFTNPVIFNTTQITATASGLTNNSLYYWRVRSKRTADTSSWSVVRSFTTEQLLLATPALISPADLATKISTGPTLSWNSVSSATDYEVQYSKSSSFSTTTSVATSSTSTALMGLTTNTTYYWRVLASASGYQSSIWSSVYSFKTTAGAKKEAAIEDAVSADGASRQPAITCHPNPFGSVATIEIRLEQPGYTHLALYDLVGVEVLTIAGAYMGIGTSSFTIMGDGLHSGVYYCRLMSGGAVVTKQLQLVR